MIINDNLKDHILESIAEGVFTVDKNFKINFFNKAAEKITGFKREEVLGKFCKHIFRTNQCYSNCPIALALESNSNIYDLEAQYTKKNGDPIPIKFNSAVLYNENEEPTGGIVTFRDISELVSFKKAYSKETQFHGVIGVSKQMQEIFELIREISASDAPVLIHGESGTGKEMIANAIQATSARCKEKFIKVSCSVFPSNLLASELFGHVKGAFTDAHKDRAGRFEIAERGTIFLDEVAEMPLQTQLQLLRVLQEGAFERVGESVTRKADVRVISATNMDLEASLQKGIFREDLYYRLSVIPIEIPPLRDRMEDVIPLSMHFLNKFSLYYRKEIKEIDDKALDILLNYDWPGNIRELENALEYAFVRTINHDRIEANKLPPAVRHKIKDKSNGTSGKQKFITDDNEAALILSLLAKHKWNKTKVAKELGMGRTTLWRKMNYYGLE